MLLLLLLLLDPLLFQSFVKFVPNMISLKFVGHLSWLVRSLCRLIVAYGIAAAWF